MNSFYIIMYFTITKREENKRKIINYIIIKFKLSKIEVLIN